MRPALPPNIVEGSGTLGRNGVEMTLGALSLLVKPRRNGASGTAQCSDSPLGPGL